MRLILGFGFFMILSCPRVVQWPLSDQAILGSRLISHSFAFSFTSKLDLCSSLA